MVRKFFQKLLFVFFILILSNSFESYSQQTSFRHLTINDGLSQNAVFAILRDSKGFMWFGTKDGLNRYDGYSFVVYQHNPFDSTTISANFITALFEDSRRLIWIGTLNGGLNCYDRSSENFYHIRYSPKEADTFSEIKSITEDKSGNIWIGTKSDGLIKLSFSGKNLFQLGAKQYLPKEGKINSLSSSSIADVQFDSEGILWVGTENGLNEFDPQTEKFNHYKIQTRNPKAPASPNDGNVNSIYESKNGDLWLGTLSGLVKFNRNDKSYKLYPHHFEVYRYGWGNIIQIIEDNFGKLWLAAPGELMCFDPSVNSYSYFKNDPFNPQSLSFNSISSLYFDNTSILWIGTAGMGINIYDFKSNRFSSLTREKDSNSRIAGFSIRSILEENENVLWISADVLYRWNRKTGELKSYETSSNKLDNFGNTGVWSMIKSHDGKIWTATTEGVYRYDPLTEKANQYKYNPANADGLPQKEIYYVLEDSHQTIWIATLNYLSKLIDVDRGIFQHFRYQTDFVTNDEVKPIIYQDTQGNFWVGTKDGLKKFDPLLKKFKSYSNDPSKSNSLNNNSIKSICADPHQPNKYLWIGTAGGGLNRFDFDDESFTHFTEANGLPNNVVYGILPDGNGNLWLSTNKGLSKFSLKDFSFRNFDVRDGLQSNEFNSGAYFRSKSGEMFFGGINGLNYFYPNHVPDNSNKPNVVLTSFKVHDTSISVKRNNAILSKSICETDKIFLSHDQDVITFEFAAMDYSAPEKNQYAYKLENFNHDWIYSGSVRTATYTNLSPGKYKFRVKASNNDGVWNEQGISIDLIINPPWWRTWWAYSMYIILFLSGLSFLRRYEMNRLHWKNQLKLEKVETDALRKLDQLKSQFFANISHEFRTPLTLILGQVESVMSSNIELKEKGKLQVANRNARRLLSLINQLLDLSKLESGSMELKSEQHNIISFLKSLFYSFESIAEAQKIKLKFESDLSNVPVVFDPDKMEKVIYNLISNAFKFTPADGEIKIKVSVIESLKVEIRISDTGKGIPEDRLSHIFNRFYQVDDSLTREHEGTGIGLALTKELVELHKGSISVKSKVGEGSEFIIQLPLGNLNVDKEKLVEISSEQFFPNNIPNELEIADDIVTDNPVSGVRNPESGLMNPASEESKDIVLIVEDNADVRTYIREQLEKDYRIFEACDGKDGISKASNEIPDLIVTDVMMPQIDGFHFTKLIRNNEKTSHIPIVMLTAKAALDDKIEGLETGVDTYLTKPFSAKELKATVRNLIYQRQQLRKRFSSATVIKPSEITAHSVDREFLKKTVKIIEEHFEDEKFSVEILANLVNMSVSQLNRKLNALINQPSGQLIRSLKLQRAADLLKHNGGTVAEICYQLGFTDQAYFSRVFKKQFGLNPSEFKKDNSVH